MQLARTLLVGLLVVTLLMGCSTEKDSVMISPLPEVNNKFTPSIIWHHSIGDGSGEFYSKLSPAYDDFIVYAADRKGTVKAIDVDSGAMLWSIDLSQQVGFFTANLPALLSSGLTVSGDKLYLGTENGKVIALNKTNGKIEWETDVSGEALSQPVVSDGLVLIHTSNGVLQALDSQTGKNKWSINLDTSTLSIRGKSSPATAYGVAIVGSVGGRITAIILDQGRIAWQQYISQIRGTTEIDRLHDVNITPIIDTNSSTIFAIAYNGNLVAMDMRSSQIIWKRDLGTVNDIIVANDIIYLVDQNDRVLAVHKNNGITSWTQDALLHRNLTAPIIYDGYLVIGDGEGYLHWLDTQDGQFVAQNKIDSLGLRSHPIIASDKLLIQAKNGTIYLIER
ncbi:MAG: outer membrane protein assembly factor BamB [Arsenophonus sp. NC-WZS1-MAG3]